MSQITSQMIMDNYTNVKFLTENAEEIQALYEAEIKKPMNELAPHYLGCLAIADTKATAIYNEYKEKLNEVHNYIANAVKPPTLQYLLQNRKYLIKQKGMYFPEYGYSNIKHRMFYLIKFEKILKGYRDELFKSQNRDAILAIDRTDLKEISEEIPDAWVNLNDVKNTIIASDMTIKWGFSLSEIRSINLVLEILKLDIDVTYDNLLKIAPVLAEIYSGNICPGAMLCTRQHTNLNNLIARMRVFGIKESTKKEAPNVELSEKEAPNVELSEKEDSNVNPSEKENKKLKLLIEHNKTLIKELAKYKDVHARVHKVLDKYGDEMEMETMDALLSALDVE